jgi:hypothetical protein
MMTQNFYGTANNGFREYLASSMSNMFAIDLSNCTVIECIDKMCEIKERSHPNIRQNYRMLVNKLRDIFEKYSAQQNTQGDWTFKRKGICPLHLLR